MGNGPGGQPRPATPRAERDESGRVQPMAETTSWDGLLAMALLWAVPVVGFVLAMLVGGSHP